MYYDLSVVSEPIIRNSLEICIGRHIFSFKMNSITQSFSGGYTIHTTQSTHVAPINQDYIL